MPHQFLSPEWITEARAIRDEFHGHLDVPAEAPSVRVNLVVTDVPFGDGFVHAHTETAQGRLAIELGHLPEPDLTVTVDHKTAKAIVVDQRPEVALQAFLFGRIVVDGDLTRLATAAMAGGDPAALLAGLDLSGMGSLAASDPAVAAVGERLRAITS